MTGRNDGLPPEVESASDFTLACWLRSRRVQRRRRVGECLVPDVRVVRERRRQRHAPGDGDEIGRVSDQARHAIPLPGGDGVRGPRAERRVGEVRRHPPWTALSLVVCVCVAVRLDGIADRAPDVRSDRLVGWRSEHVGEMFVAGFATHRGEDSFGASDAERVTDES